MMGITNKKIFTDGNEILKTTIISKEENNKHSIKI